MHGFAIPGVLNVKPLVSDKLRNAYDFPFLAARQPIPRRGSIKPRRHLFPSKIRDASRVQYP